MNGYQSAVTAARVSGLARHIADIRPRTRVLVAGTIRAAQVVTVGGSPTWRCTLADGTGQLDLLFLGRAEVAGLQPGRRCAATGTAVPADLGDGERLVIWNPCYELEPAGGPGNGRPRRGERAGHRDRPARPPAMVALRAPGLDGP